MRGHSSSVVKYEVHKLSIFQNPATENVFVKFTTADIQTVACKLMDATGKILEATSFVASCGENTRKINVSYLASGFYMVKLDTKSGKVIRKVIVQ